MDDKVFIFYSERFKSRAEIIENTYPGVRAFKLEGDYDDLVKRVFELSGSNKDRLSPGLVVKFLF